MFKWIVLNRFCLTAMNSRRKVTGELGKPEDSEEWLKNYMDEKRKLKQSKSAEE